MPSKHKFDMNSGKITKGSGGVRRMMSNMEFPSFSNMALATITLEKGGIRDPHWHPHANELLYCAEGKALITIFSPGNLQETFILNKGEISFFPTSYIHYIENIADEASVFILAYNAGNPADLELTDSIDSMTSHVLDATFTAPIGTFDKLINHVIDPFISKRKEPLKLKSINEKSLHKFNIEEIKPQIDTPGGSAKIANATVFPILDGLALFSLRINKNGIREPHWHPNATELNYVLKGKARLTILSPAGDKDTFELSEGQGSIIPAGYFHHIENIGSEELMMTVFFNNCMPGDIGLSGALSAFPSEVLASFYSVGVDYFKNIKSFSTDRMIVNGG